jgi:hypothetical protein
MVKKIKHVLVCIKKRSKISFFYLKKVDSDLLKKDIILFLISLKKQKIQIHESNVFGVLFTWFHWDFRSWVPEHGFQIIGFQNMGSRTWISEHGFQDMDFRTWISGHGFQNMDFRTWISEHGFQIMGSRTCISGHGFQNMYFRMC